MVDFELFLPCNKLIMVTFKPLDESCPIHQQLGEDVSPVVLVNIFNVAPEDVDALTKAWEEDANWMKRQPGYISTQLHRSIGASCVFMNYAVWESVSHFKDAFGHPDFKAAMGAYPSSTVASPHLFEKVAVPNLCTT
jgi:heme-degrading monooxygenase HmoA